MIEADAFFDTNVLLYMYDGDAAKRVRALELFHLHSHAGRIMLSTQVVQEFYSAGSRKLVCRELNYMRLPLLELPLVVLGPSHPSRGA